MSTYAYLVAVYSLTSRYHSGQWSRGYRLLCHAQHYCRRWHAGCDLGRTCEQLAEHRLYPRGSDFRRAVAHCLRRLRVSRHAL